jgi:peroxiredoxin
MSKLSFRYYLLLLTYSFTTLAYGQSLAGKIKGGQGLPVYLQNYKGYQSFTIDSCTINAVDSFKMHFPEGSYHGIYRLLLKPHSDPEQQIAVDMFYDGNDIILSTNMSFPYEYLTYYDKTNKKYGEFISSLYVLHNNLDLLENLKKEYIGLRFLNIVNAEQRKLLKKLDNLYQSYIKKNKNNISLPHIRFRYSTDPFLHPFYGIKFNSNVLDNVFTSDPALARDAEPCRYVAALFSRYYPIGATREQALKYMDYFTEVVIHKTADNPGLQNSLLVFLTKGYEQMGAFEILEKILTLHYQNTSCSEDEKQDLQQRIEKLQSVLPGQLAPLLTVRDSTGTAFSLPEMPKSKYLIIFWSPYCTHCVQELPNWKNVKGDLTKSGIKIIGISLHEDSVLWKEMIKTALPFDINLIDSQGWKGQTADNWAVVSTPVMYLIDENSRIIGRFRTIEEAMKFL